MDPSTDTLTAAAATGKRLTVLRALRDRLARDLDGTRSARDLASLSQRLMDVLAQIDELGGGTVPAKVVTPLDEFTQALVDRQAAAGARRPTG